MSDLENNLSRQERYDAFKLGCKYRSKRCAKSCCECCCSECNFIVCGVLLGFALLVGGILLIAFWDGSESEIGLLEGGIVLLSILVLGLLCLMSYGIYKKCKKCSKENERMYLAEKG